jgi:hypothetical protein
MKNYLESNFETKYTFNVYIKKFLNIFGLKADDMDIIYYISDIQNK